MTVNVLGVFAKYWAVGQVKTRLAAHLGGAAAARVQLAMLRTTLGRFAAAADSRCLAVWPPDRLAEFEVLAGDDWVIVTQAPGDLGLRMWRFFADRFREGASKVVLIGSDSPTLPLCHLEAAFDQLERNDVVLGPSDDGGYYLIGATNRLVNPADRPVGVFENMPWSTDAVLVRTVERLEQDRVPFALLPTWYDIDRREDLDRLRNELRGPRDVDSHLARLSRELDLLADGP